MPRHRPGVAARRLTVGLAGLLLLLTPAARAASYPLNFYVPFPEADYLNGLDTINTNAVNSVYNFISIAVVSGGTIIRYDHWEDGYDPAGDDDTPAQSTTQVWGDNNPSNGIPPGYTTDVLRAGSVILLTNAITTTSPAPTDYDARDRVAANRTISLTRTFWASGSSTLMAGCVETFDVSLWGTDYRVPIGEDAADSRSMFQYTALSIMAAETGTTVRVDADNNGSFETTNVLSRGGTMYVDGGVNVGGRVLSDKPVQVVMLAGDIGSNYESRDSSLLPVSLWGTNYVTPVSTRADDGTRVWLYNPTNTPVTVLYDYRVTNGSLTSSSIVVPASTCTNVLLPDKAGARFYTTNSPARVFYAYSTTDSDGTDGDNQAWDWSFTMFPVNLLSPQVLVGLGIGRNPLSAVNTNENGNPVWITPVGNGESNVTVYVDFNGDNQGANTDTNGFKYDTSYSLKELQAQRVFDPDGDQSGMLLYVISTNGKVSLAAAWGQDPTNAAAGEPGLDVGTSIPPTDVLDVSKTLSVTNDTNGDGLLGPSDRAFYTISVGNGARTLIPAAFVVKDIVPEDTTYVTNSTERRTSTNNPWTAVADDTSGTPFPLDGPGLTNDTSIGVRDFLQIRFQVDVDAYADLASNRVSIVNTGEVRALVFNRTITFENETPLRGSIGDRVWYDANINGTQDVGEVGIDGVFVYLDVNTNGVWDANEPNDTTSGDGEYLLTGPALVAGTHLVRIDTGTLPAGALATYDLDGTSTLHRASVALLGGQDRRDADFGYRLPAPPLQIVKTSGAGAAALAPGQTNTYTITISNTGTVAQTGVRVTDLLPSTLRYVSNSTVVVGYKGTGLSVSNSVLDTFANRAYTNNYGTTNWSGAWGETNDGGSATAGRIQVNTGGELAFDQLNDLDGIYRSVNLAGATNAFLSFSWRQESLESADGEWVDVEVSSNGVAPWTRLLRVNNSLGASGTLTTNITSFAGTNTTVRFYFDGTDGTPDWDNGNDEAYFDDVQIVYWVPNSLGVVTNDNVSGGAYPDLTNGVPPDMVTAADGFSLPTGATMTVRFDAVVTNSLPPGTSNIVNTAGTRSDQWPVWLYASCTNPVVGAATIGDRVWLDEDGDGLQDAGEDGIGNAKVELLGAGGAVVATTYTDGNGGYLFAGLLPGAYTVRVDNASMPAGLAANPTYDEDGTNTAHRSAVTVAGGEEHLTADFGYNWAPPPDVIGNKGTGAIGDRIWIDADGDGRQDPGEPGLSNITVRLYRDADTNGTYETLVAVTNTDAAGLYIFDGLAAGAYVVEVNNGTAPANYTQTGDPDYFGATLPAGARDNKTTTPIVLAPGDVFVNADFGYQPDGGTSGSIGDRVWLDADADGAQDAGEQGIQGVTVALIRDLDGDGVWDAGEPIIATTITGTNGLYAFTGLPVTNGVGTDDYLVWVNDTATVLAGLTPTFDFDGTAPASGVKSGYGISAVADLAPAGTTAHDFGYTVPGQTAGKGLIGDTIFLDRNADNIPDTGEGLEGVTVRLYDSGGATLLATTVTDENGNYYFGGLDTNSVTYVVKVDTNTLPFAGLSNTYDPDGGANSQSSVILTGVNLAQDFGYRDTSSPNAIGGTIWEDRNADGTLVAGETNRFTGVTVVLLNTNGNIVGTTVTDASGNYSFTNLPDGTYVVDVTDEGNVLNGYWHSDGTNDNVDGNSQVDPYTVAVSGGTNNTTGDFGYYVDPAALGNRTWLDSDKDGIQDVGETAVTNVTIRLTIRYPDGTTNMVATVSDTNGFFSFGNLLLDEQFTTAGVSNDMSRPMFWLSVASFSTGLVSTLAFQGGDVWLDSGRFAGTDAYPVKGVTAMGLNTVDPTQEPLAASFDFGFVVKTTLARLVGLRGYTRGGETIIEWQTAEEIGTAGYYLERMTGAGEYERINGELIPAQPLAMDAATYEQADAGARSGGSYVYRLIEVEVGGTLRYLGPYQVTIDGEVLSLDEWSRMVFGATGAQDPAVSGAEADPDGDGLSNLVEFMTGSNPLNRDSALKIEGVGGLESEGFRVRWQSQSNRFYRIEWTTNLLEGYRSLETGILATPPENQYFDTRNAGAEPVFYRIVLE